MSPDLQSQTIGDFLKELSERTPTPGGGAVAATSLALAASMAHMAVNYSQGRKSLQSFDPLHTEAMALLATLPSEALQMAREDAQAYGRLNDLWKLQEDDPVRIEGWDQAVDGAINAPVKVMRQAHATLELLSRLVEATTPMLLSDLAVAAITAESAARSAHWNVLINLPSVRDATHAESVKCDAEALLEACSRLTRLIEQGCRPN